MREESKQENKIAIHKHSPSSQRRTSLSMQASPSRIKRGTKKAFCERKSQGIEGGLVPSTEKDSQCITC